MGRGEKRRGCDARVERKSKKKPGDEDRAEPRLEGEAGIDDRRGYDAGLERKSKKKRGGEDRAEPRLEGEAGVDDRGHPTREDVKPIPEIRQNWMHVGERVCDLFPHIFEIYKVPSDDNSQVVFQSKELLKRKEDRFQFLRGCLETLELDGWFTAGYNDPERKFYTFFYAEGGSGRANQHGVYWYTSKRDAMRALQRVLSFSCLEERKYRRILNIEKADSSE